MKLIEKGQAQDTSGKFKSKLTPKITNKILRWIDKEMLIEHMVRRLVRQHSVVDSTAVRWIMRSQSIDLARKIASVDTA